ncbi:DeoR family transcriptional regulator [Tsukamurella soli]|uniref:DeoR family transcriptional regulator n=1 Tax=Tsukamurella soli TaxID=644556 RepID=UPI00360F0D91
MSTATDHTEESTMNADTRQQDILAQLSRRGEVAITELSVRYGVSEMTVRRDLNQLASAGLVVRTHGGAAPAASGSFEPRSLSGPEPTARPSGASRSPSPSRSSTARR